MSVFFCVFFFSFLQKVFLKSDRVARMVHSGGCSANDFRDVFKKNIEKRVRSLPEIDGLSKETVLSSWLAKYDAIYRGEEDFCKQPNRMALSAVSELILSKEQLYEMFQQILGIKKLEHQLIYNACQVSIGVTQFCCVQNLSIKPLYTCVPTYKWHVHVCVCIDTFTYTCVYIYVCVCKHL